VIDCKLSKITMLSLSGCFRSTNHRPVPPQKLIAVVPRGLRLQRVRRQRSVPGAWDDNYTLRIRRYLYDTNTYCTCPTSCPLLGGACHRNLYFALHSLEDCCTVRLLTLVSPSRKRHGHHTGPPHCDWAPRTREIKDRIGTSASYYSILSMLLRH
jgi:hypothetical protein